MELSLINQVTPNRFEDHLKFALSKVSPKDILTSKELCTCFEEFFQRGTSEDCRQLLPQPYRSVIFNTKQANAPSATTSPPPLSQYPSPDSISTVACLSSASTPSLVAKLQFDCNSIYKHFETTCNNAERARLLARLVQSFVDGKHLPLARYSHLWCGRVKIFDKKIKGRVERLGQGRQNIKNNQIEYNCAARLSLLCAVNEVDHYSLTASPEELELRSSRNRRTAGPEKFAKIYELDPRELKKDRNKSKNLFSLMYKVGPGSLLEIQVDTPSDWERATEDDLDLVLDYRKAYFPEIDRRAQTLNAVGAHTIVNCLLENGWTPAQIITSPTPFLKQIAKHLDKNLEIPQDQISAIRTLDTDFQLDVGSESDDVFRNETFIESVCDDCQEDRASTRTLTTNHNVYQPQEAGASMELLYRAAVWMNSTGVGNGQYLGQEGFNDVSNTVLHTNMGLEDFNMPQDTSASRSGFDVLGILSQTNMGLEDFNMPQDTSASRSGFDVLGILSQTNMGLEDFNMPQDTSASRSGFDVLGILSQTNMGLEDFNMPQDTSASRSGFDVLGILSQTNMGLEDFNMPQDTSASRSGFDVLGILSQTNMGLEDFNMPQDTSASRSGFDVLGILSQTNMGLEDFNMPQDAHSNQAGHDMFGYLTNNQAGFNASNDTFNLIS